MAGLALVGAGLVIFLSHKSPTAFGWAADLAVVSGDGIRGHRDGDAGTARFSDPFALAFDPDGSLYVADAGDTDRIRKLEPSGRISTLPGVFDTPSGLAIDPMGNVIVADTGANAIRKISPAGVLTTIAGGAGPGYRDGPASQALFNGPIGIAVDDRANVYVADTYNDRIRVITAAGLVRTLAGGSLPGFADGQGSAAAFNTPCGLALDGDGNLLIADTGNDAIRRVDKDGHVMTLARTAPDDRGGVLKAPVGVARTWDGFLYVSSFRRGRIVQIAPSGRISVLLGPDALAPGNAALRMGSPAGLALDRDGALYIADSSQYAVLKLVPRGQAGRARSLILRSAPPAFVHASPFPWPVRPQTGWHEVVGTLGEVRGNSQGEARDHLHSGLDISAAVGEPVLAVTDEKVVDPLPNWSLGGLSEGLRVDAMTYIHMKVGRTATGASLDPARFSLLRDAQGRLTAVRVKRGTRFRAGDQLGTINAMAHVHLELGPPGGKINALMLRFAGFTDRFAPRIETIQLVDGAGRRLTGQRAGRLLVPRDSGPLSIVVDAWDQVDDNLVRRRLGLYSAGFQILRSNGSPVPGFEKPKINLVFDRMPREPDAVKVVYGAASGDSVHSAQPTRFNYVVSNRAAGGGTAIGGWNPGDLSPGHYTIRIFAADYAGNLAQANRDQPIVVQ
ncbi:hypothetical protein [Novosphingobium sp. JCM 18896]|uniref:hypothetical protein n=1 Tax=Novosphingobium sp. JCM 18896 TaxID=2989731 RepID=UPI00222391A0|nr:hypothetical protein [Novosphingobium sp. JCM 18896]